MKRLLLGFGVYLLALWALTALLSPVVFWTVDTIMPGAFPFKRVFNRVLMVDALLLLWPLAHYWRIRQWSAIGICKGNDIFNVVVRGWALGLGSLGFIAVLELVLGARVWAVDIGPGDATSYFLGSTVIGVVEEVLFRGVFYMAIARLVVKEDAWGHRLLAAVLSSLFYSVAHFAKVQHIEGTISWNSGFLAWGTIFDGSAGVNVLVMRGIGLFLVGMCLCALVERQGVLWGAMGLHSGWVFMLKSVERLTDMNEESRWAGWIFGQDLVSGADTYLLLSLLFVLIILPSYRFGSKWRGRGE